jgi:hypothetical protein
VGSLKISRENPMDPSGFDQQRHPLAQLFSDLFYPKSFIGETERMQKCHVGGFEDLLFSVFREFERDFVC